MMSAMIGIIGIVGVIGMIKTRWLRGSVWMVSGITAAIVLGGCGKGTTSGDAEEDSSASGAAAAALGEALSGSSTSGVQAFYAPRIQSSVWAKACDMIELVPSAMAASSCPTFRSSSSAGCSSSGGTLWLSYSDCSFGGSASWTGTQALAMSSGSAVCGTFPNPGASGTLTRQFVASAGSTTPSTASVTWRGLTVQLDDESDNLKNFDGASIAKIANGGYGVQVAFGADGRRASVTIARRKSMSEGLLSFDHSVSGQLSVSETEGATSRTVSGSVKVYHNLAQVVGTSVFDSVVHSNDCCLPVSGTITTTFAKGANVDPTLVGARFVGKTESLTFTGCGTGTLTRHDGTTVDVSLSRCL